MKKAAPTFGRAMMFLGAIALAGCSEDTAPTEEIVRPVYVHEVTAGSATIARSFSGVVGVAEGVDLSFEVSGRIVELTAKAGQSYDRRAVLARLDSSDYLSDLNNAEAQFAVAEADLNRTLRLFESNTASKSQLDADMAKREAAKASLDIAKKKLRNCRLTMPYAGVIGRVVADSQQVIGPGDTIVTIQNREGFEIEFGVPVDVIDLMKGGAAVDITVGAFPERAYDGVIQEIAPQIGENTTYPVTARFVNNPPEVKEGMDGEVSVTLPNPNGSAMAVPSVAVASAPDGSRYAWVIEPSGDFATVRRRVIVVGTLRPDGMLEVRSGLSENDRIVSRGVHRVREGQSVKILSAKPLGS